MSYYMNTTKIVLRRNEKKHEKIKNFKTCKKLNQPWGWWLGISKTLFDIFFRMLGWWGACLKNTHNEWNRMGNERENEKNWKWSELDQNWTIIEDDVFGHEKSILTYFFMYHVMGVRVVEHTEKRSSYGKTMGKMKKLKSCQIMTKVEPPSKMMFGDIKTILKHIFWCSM